jgi:hypothetical protein
MGSVEVLLPPTALTAAIAGDLNKQARATGQGGPRTPQTIARARHTKPFYALWVATPETAVRL